MATSADPDDLTPEIRRVFDEFERATPGVNRQALGTWTAPVDVIETADAFEVVADVAGVPATQLRVFFKAGAAVIIGEKLPPPGGPVRQTAFHLVEREFGRFARTLHFTAAIDVRAATARLVHGELRLRVPKRHDRRGEQIAVPINGRDANA